MIKKKFSNDLINKNKEKFKQILIKAIKTKRRKVKDFQRPRHTQVQKENQLGPRKSESKAQKEFFYI